VEVILAEPSGFCYGVKRALDTLLDAAKERGKRMYTLGPLIHNPQVIEKLEREGIRSVASLDEISPPAVLVMPSHGVGRDIMESAISRGMEVTDVTCPFVSKVHRLAESLVRQKYQVVIVGDQGHTEVKSIVSRAGEDAVVVSGVEELASRDLKRRVGIVAQTTQAVERFQECVSEAARRVYEVRAYNTICHATSERQAAAVKTAQAVDVMIVVGGRNSANTRRLAEICAQAGVPTHHVEIADELEACWFAVAKKVGVTAGASTPDWIIQEVVRRIKEIPAA
jgi:4-hydroxy-3-methylbut-2-enyl diphosphate reductase